MIGDPAQVTTEYYQGGFSGRGTEFMPTETTQGYRDETAVLRRARLVDSDRRPIEFARIDQKIGVEMEFDVLESGHRLVPNIHVFAQGQYAFVSSPAEVRSLPAGSYVSIMWIPANLLNEGIYVAGVALSTMSPVRAHFYVPDCIMFSVVDDLSDPARHDYTQAIPGIVRPKLEWSTAAQSEIERAS